MPRHMRSALRCLFFMHVALGLTPRAACSLPSARSLLRPRGGRSATGAMTSSPLACAANASSSAGVPEGLSAGCRGAPLQPGTKLPLAGEESIMRPKAHGTTETGVQAKLRWSCDPRLADRICWCVPCARGGASRRAW